MRRTSPFFDIVIGVLLAMLLVLLFGPAFADEDCRGHSCNDSGPDISIDANSDVSTTVRDTSRALGFGAGDVDINDCYRSYSVILWQDSKPNPLCLAQQLMAEGNYQAAAVLRCEPRSIHRAFGGKDACIKTLSVPTAPFQVAPVIDEHIDEEEEWHEEQLQLQVDYDARIAQLEERLNRPAPQVIERTVVEQKPLLTRELAEELKVKK